MIVDTNDLDQAFDAYKNGKIMRKDMLRHICDHLIAIEATVKALQDGEAERKLSADFLNSKVAEVGSRLDRLNEEIDAKVATAVNYGMSLAQSINGGSIPRQQPPNPAPMQNAPMQNINSPLTPHGEAKRRGRPPKQPQAEAGG